MVKHTPADGMTGKCSYNADASCTDNPSECMGNAKCVENTHTSGTFYCKVSAATEFPCGIETPVAGAAGTPIPCAKENDTCEQGLSDTVHFCKAKVADGATCKASPSTTPDTDELVGTMSGCLTDGSTC